MLNPALVWAAAGEAIFVLGKVTIQAPDGSERVLEKGGEINAGDIIVTTAKGHAQIRMDDGGMIAVRPDSRFEIAEFSYEGDIDNDKSVFGLIKGGFRSVTGAVGQANKKAYSVKTPVATIGIRGTDYVARLCDMDCTDMGVDDGLYVGVLSGGVTLTNGKGAVNIDPGEYGFAGTTSDPALMDTAPTELLFVKVDPANGKASDTQIASNGALPAEGGMSGSMDNGENLVASFDTQATSGTGETVDYSNTAKLADPVTYTTVAMAGSTTGVGSGETSLLTTDASGNLLGFDVTLNGDASSTTVAVADTNTLMESGSDAGTGISWGRWSGTDATLSGGTSGTEDLTTASLHWIAGPDLEETVSLPMVGSANYAMVGGTTPTDDAGNTGTLTTASLTVDFSAQSVDASVTADMGGTTWTGTSTGLALNSDGSYGGGMNGITVSDAFSYNSTSGSLSGALVGPADATTGAPSAATMGYSMTADYTDNGTFSNHNTTVSGTAAMALQ